MIKYLVLLSFILSNILFGSAILFGGEKTQTVNFNSEPNGAIVKIDGLERCTTPCTLELERHRYNNVEFTKDGYHKSSITLVNDDIRPIFWANILFIIPAYSTADMVSNRAYEYSQDKYFVELKKKY
jgi:hypothetical protein